MTGDHILVPRPVALRFAGVMEARLRANDHKGHWLQCSGGHLRAKLKEEARELLDALEHGDPIPAVVNEAADVANVAAMLHDRRRVGRRD